ncbi:hypothetical protein KKG22_00555 [Patescibacteria group bacterium]|nr:hypothetical protein [Patescibacteria group bacterium]MBU1721487.1 hypothetical protein [Patescibacteria group bacterium]MBU1901346.1 hypothetical protein [Patescibacteria group bacterium]
MKNIFLVFGYGIPKNILKDENYNFYLKMVFNQIYSLVVENNIDNPVIICSGGKTDLYKPHKRTEGAEMVKLLKNIAKRPFLKKVTKDWLFVPEKTSLSTLENFLNCRAILNKKGIQKASLYVFCEKTREKRIQRLAKETLDKNYNFQVLPVDFDISENRYLDPKFIAKKEKLVLKHDLWALENPENLKKYHKLFEEKFEFLRKAGPNAHTKAVKAWWEKKINDLEEKN